MNTTVLRVLGIASWLTLVAGADSALAQAQGRPSVWESRGIGGGGALMDPSFSPHDDRLFVACDMSELFRSTDLGKHWQSVNHAQLQGNRGSRVQFTSDPNRVYAIDQTGELPVPAISNDGGVTWSRVAESIWPADRTAYSLWADPDSTQRLFVGTDDALWLSTDAGAHFSSVYQSPSATGLHVAGVLFDATTVYVGSSDGLLRSSNSGASFAAVATPGFPADAGFLSFAGARNGTQRRLVGTAVARSALYPGVFVEDAFGAVYRGAFRLDPGQSTWVSASAGISANDTPVLVAMARNDLDNITLAGAIDPNQGEWPVVYRSSNGGASWSQVFGTTNNQNIATGWEGQGGDRNYSYGGGLIGLAVSPGNAQRIAVTDYGFVHVSEDGGAHWRQAYVDPADQHDAGQLTPPGRAYRSVGLENTSVWSVAWSDPQHLFAGFSDIRGIRSEDAGVSWSFDYTGHSDNSMYRVVRDASGALYAATATIHDLYQSTYLSDARIDGAGGRVLRSTDHGRTWTLVHNFNHAVAWVALDAADPNRAYAQVAHSTEGGVWTTANLGAGSASTWTRLSAPPRTQGHGYNIVVLSDGALVASYSGRRDSSGAFTATSGVFYKASGASAWEDRSDPGMRYWTKDVVIDPHDPAQNTWYTAVFSGWGGPANGLGGVYRSTNRGVTWTRISALDRVESVTVSPTDANLAFVTTETEGLWFTANLQAASPTFQRDAAYPFRQPVRVIYNPNNANEIWVTSFGGGLRVGTTSGSDDVVFRNGFE